VDADEPMPALRAAWQALGQDPRAIAGAASPAALLRQAVAAFMPEAIPAGPAR
jgi:glutamyl-Q tRNA(Asp) synthetase